MGERGSTRIAFLAREITGATAGPILSGVHEAAAARACDLVVLKGGQLGRDPAAMLYRMIGPGSFDGIVSWASSSEDECGSFLDRFKGIPVVTLSLKLPGRPSVSVDTYAGMRQVVAHLIEAHRLERIAFVRGPEAHVYARERYQAYLDALKAAGITFREKLVSPCGTWDTGYGREAVRVFLDERALRPGADIQAIVCVNDNTAIGALESLVERGVRVPEDLAVTGYNDSKEARCMTPPITSVAMPFHDQGYRAVEIVLDLLSGKGIAEDHPLPARLVLGQSCGCQSRRVLEAAAGPHAELGRKRVGLAAFLGHAPAEKPTEIGWDEDDLRRIARSMAESALKGQYHVESLEETIRSESRGLLGSFFDDSRRGESGRFLSGLSGILRLLADDGLEIDSFQDAVSDMRRRLLPRLSGSPSLPEAEDLWARARVMIGETAGRVRESGHLVALKRERAMQDIGVRLIATYDIPRLLDILEAELPKLGIPSFYLMLYDDSRAPKEAGVPETAGLVMAYGRRGRVPLPVGGLRFRTRDIVPREVLSEAGRQSLVLEALNFDDYHFGYLALEMGPRDGAIYESLRTQLSSALYGATLLQDNVRVKNVLQETLVSMEGKAQVVSGGSEKIAGHVNEVSAAMEEVAASIRGISRNVRDVMDMVRSAVETAQGAKDEMTALSRRSAEIDGIVRMITDIAEKTKILSLNAAIEAARAGAAGKGFAVVAKEVKELALGTVSSADSIASMIQKVQEGTRETEAAIGKVKEIIGRVSDLSAMMTLSIAEQERASNEISALLVEAARGTAEISAAIQEVARIGRSAEASLGT